MCYNKSNRLDWSAFVGGHKFAVGVCRQKGQAVLICGNFYLYCVGHCFARYRDDAGRILDNDDPASRYNLIGYSVGITAFFAGVFLLSGWWFRSDRLMRWGLLASAAMAAARSAFLFMDLGWGHAPAWISLGLVFASGGAWLLERTAVHARGE